MYKNNLFVLGKEPKLMINDNLVSKYDKSEL